MSQNYQSPYQQQQNDTQPQYQNYAAPPQNAVTMQPPTPYQSQHSQQYQAPLQPQTNTATAPPQNPDFASLMKSAPTVDYASLMKSAPQTPAATTTTKDYSSLIKSAPTPSATEETEESDTVTTTSVAQPGAVHLGIPHPRLRANRTVDPPGIMPLPVIAGYRPRNPHRYVDLNPFDPHVITPDGPVPLHLMGRNGRKKKKRKQGFLSSRLCF